MLHRLSEMKSQLKKQIFFKNLRTLRAGGIKSTEQKEGVLVGGLRMEGKAQDMGSHL